MAGSVNKVILVGNLGRDPEIRRSQNNDKIVTMSVATSENWKDRETGERRDKTEWHRVVVFDKFIADICENYLKKGSKVYVEGQLQTRKWTGNDGIEKYFTEVVLGRFNSTLTMLDSRSGGDDTTGPPGPDWGGPDAGGSASGSDGGGSTTGIDLDDEIPF